MSKQHGLGHQFYVGGYDLSGDVAAIVRAESPREARSIRGINKSAEERVLLHGDGALEFNTWFNDAANQEHAVLKTLPTANVIMTWLLGDSQNEECACLVAKQVGYDWSRSPDGELLGTVRGVASNGVPLEWLDLLSEGLQTHFSAFSSVGIVETQSVNGLIAYLQIFTLGSGTPTVLIEDSADTTNGIDGAWGTLLALTSQTARSAERATVTGTVEKGLRVTTTGVFTNCVFIVAYRRGLAADDLDLS